MARPIRKRYISHHQHTIDEWRGLSEAPEGLRLERAMEDLIPETLTKLKMRNAYTEEEICSAWEVVVGAQLAKHTRPSGLRRGVLQVSVSQSTVHYAIQGMKSTLLTRLQEKFGTAQVQDIHFRMGS